MKLVKVGPSSISRFRVRTASVERQARVGAVGEADRRRRVHVEGEAPVDALELVRVRALWGRL